ncbi:Flp family type IVb pilin [Variovorax paradoxus]|uniref:Flp family type IVb pilin n=1 Tax=Variovorax paradoxus TaxID=34073 RepID=A0A5Q0M0Z4_VARPD|nr:Flp family type IVb pilin [Variovorax paradoxus]QFZ83390.1 Flp family type IVb pilin [Variovorax paradoxus]
MLSSITRFLRDEEGATAIEYGLIAGLISVVILVSLTDIGTNLNAIFVKVAGKLDITP